MEYENFEIEIKNNNRQKKKSNHYYIGSDWCANISVNCFMPYSI